MKTRLLIILSVLGILSVVFPAFAQVVYKEYPLTVNTSFTPNPLLTPAIAPLINVDLDEDGTSEFNLNTGTSYAGDVGNNFPTGSDMYFAFTSLVPLPASFTQCLSDKGITSFYVAYHVMSVYSINYVYSGSVSHSFQNPNLEFIDQVSSITSLPITNRSAYSTPGSYLVNSNKFSTPKIKGFVCLGFNGVAGLSNNGSDPCQVEISTGNHSGQMTDNYYPFRIKMKDNLYHYGWLQLAESGTSRTLKVAYEATAGTPIVTGQTGPLPHCNNLASVITDRATPSVCQMPSGLFYDYLDLIASPGGGSSSYIYQWRKDGVKIPGATRFTYSTFMEGSYDVIITDINNKCIDTSSVIDVVVRQVPTVNAGNNVKVCEGTNVSFTPTMSGSGPFTTTWAVCPDMTISSPDANQTFTATKTCYLSFYVEDVYGCRNHDTILLEVIPNGPITISSMGTICPPNPANLVSFTPTPQGSYYWYKNNLPISATANSAFRTEFPGEYYVVRNNECGSVQSNKINIPACMDYGVISGIVFDDANNDGIKDAAENGIPHIIVRASQKDYTITDSNGEYKLYVSASQTYEVEAIKAHSVSILTTPSTSTHEITVPATGINSFTGKDFGIHTPMFKDLQINITSSITRPGFETYYTIHCKNIGTETLSGTVSFNYNSAMAFKNALPVQSVHNSGTQTLTFDLPSLTPGTTQKFQLTFTASVTLPLGTVFTSTAEGTVAGIDSDLSNNNDSTNEIVIGSYDPNDKAVSPIGQGNDKYIASSNRLTYTIRFQNTGTYYAYNVVVKDTIDESLDLASFKSVAVSHPCEISIDSNRVITWAFNGIMLPDSNRDERNSHGFIRYALKQHVIPENTVIKNKAYIYFDFNQPIITNEVTNTVNDNLPLSNYNRTENNAYDIYPNPAGNYLKITSKYTTVQYSILDLKGRLVKQGELMDEINISDLNQGLYLIKLESKESVSYERFIKQ